MTTEIVSGQVGAVQSASVNIKEIMGPDQEEACFWLHLLQNQFPLSEQVPAGSVLRLFQAKGRGEAVDSHFFTAHDPVGGEPIGMAWIQNHPEVETAALWYLAVAPGKEGHGYGGSLLTQICRRAFEEDRYRLLVMEVETDEGHSPDMPGEAERLRQIDQRNRFYMHRHDALRLTGIHYTQQVENHAAVPMDLLVIFNPALPPLLPEETFVRLKTVFANALQRQGPLDLSSELPNCR